MRTDWWLPEAEVQRGQKGEGDQKAQAFSYKTSKPWKCYVQHGECGL